MTGKHSSRMGLPGTNNLRATIQKVDAWADSMRDPGGQYRYSPLVYDGCLYATCYRVLLAELSGMLPSWPSERRFEVGALILSRQQGDGSFAESNSERTGNAHSERYTSLHLTMCAVHALDALGLKWRRLSMLDVYRNREDLFLFINSLNLRASWNISNQIMALCSLLRIEYANTQDDNLLERIIDVCDFLDFVQDPATGLWGTNKGASLINAMAGTYHYLMFYYDLGRSIPYHDAIVRSTLSLQFPSGHFGPGGASACLDLDGLDIIAHAPTTETAQRHALAAGVAACLLCQNRDGGFAEVPSSLPLPSDVLTWLVRGLDPRMLSTTLFNAKRLVIATLLRRKTLFGGSLKACQTTANSSNMWATYARLMAVAASLRAMRHEAATLFTFRRLPTLGYWGRDER